MNRLEDNTQDTDFRVLRPRDAVDGYGIREDVPELKRRNTSWWTVAVIVIAFLIAVGAIIIGLKICGTAEFSRTDNEEIQYIYEPEPQNDSETEQFIGTVTDSTGEAFTEHVSRTVNDIDLNIYIPHGAKAELAVGTPDSTDSSIILAAQAADIRADNGKIVGAFVLRGKPVSWGLSKKGFVAIIDNEISIGVAENSPLFEEATEKDGYFFRQYPLVSEGRAIDNEPKGKAIRKAICDRNGEIMVIMSAGRESFHDFAQALADFGVDNAVYLVGSDHSYGFCRDRQGRFIPFSQKHRDSWKYENYIVWRKK